MPRVNEMVLGRLQHSLGGRYLPGWLFIALTCCAGSITSFGARLEQVTEGENYRFIYELYTSQNGLNRSQGNNTEYDNDVHTVFLDSKGQVWVGTVTGLAVYDGKKWTSRTFKVSFVTMRLLGLAESGPRKIMEGPPGSVWLGGSFGLWRCSQNRYEEIKLTPEIAGMLDMAVDHDKNLWVVKKPCVYRFDGKTWSIMLCPYIGKPASIEAPGLHSIAIATNGSVWIGGTVYGEPKGPWEHEGSVWVVDQERKKRNNGPPMAPLFEFNGKRWRAFGPPHGLNVGSASPDLDKEGKVRVWTSPSEQYIRDRETWKAVKAPEIPDDGQWILRSQGRRPELFFRDGERLVEVRPSHHKTGKVFDFVSENALLLRVTEDQMRGCVWIGTTHGLYRVWREENAK